MLTEDEKQALGRAYAALRSGEAPWQSIAPLAELARGGTDISIDFSTEATLGAPVIIANRRDAPPPDAAALAALTRRQREVCDLLARGFSNKAIAIELGLSPATVKDHVHAILNRLGLPSRAAVIASLHGTRP